jgi:penicillin amidase
VPSYRQIVDLSDFGQSLSQHTTGQSGNPFSKHYADFIEPWRQVRHHPMLFDRAAIEKNKEGILTLSPK